MEATKIDPENFKLSGFFIAPELVQILVPYFGTVFLQVVDIPFLAIRVELDFSLATYFLTPEKPQIKGVGVHGLDRTLPAYLYDQFVHA